MTSVKNNEIVFVHDDLLYPINNPEDLFNYISKIKYGNISEIYLNGLKLNSRVTISITYAGGYRIYPELPNNIFLDIDAMDKLMYVINSDDLLKTTNVDGYINYVNGEINGMLTYDYLVDNLKIAEHNAKLLELAKDNVDIAALLHLGMSQDIIPYLLSVSDSIKTYGLLQTIFDDSEIPHITETEVAFYCDIVRWLNIGSGQYRYLNWCSFIQHGSPLHSKTFALFLLFNSREETIFGRIKEPLAWLSAKDNWRSNYLSRDSSRLNMSFSRACIATIGSLDASRHLLNKRFRLAFATSSLIEKYPVAFLSSQGLLKYYESASDKYHISNRDIILHAFYLSKMHKYIRTRGLVIPPHLTMTKITSIIVGTAYFGKNAIYLTKYALEHLPNAFDPLYVIPDKFSKEVAESYNAFTWIFDLKLSVNWDKPSARLCIINSIMDSYKVSYDVAVQLYSNPGSNAALDFYSSNIPVTECNLPDFKFSHDEITMEMLPKDDIINLVIGTYTNCCQHLNGYASDVCKESWVDPNSVNYVFKRNNKIIAHMWCWLDKDKNIVIDSIEGLRNTPVESVVNIIDQFARTYTDGDLYVSKTNYGLTGEVTSCLNTTNEITPKPLYDYTYMDTEPGTDCYWVLAD